MKKGMLLASASVLIAALAAPSFAQSDLLGTRQLDDRLEDLERDVNRDLERAQDASRFGNPEFRQGLSGSASLSYSGKTGNNESQEATLGVRLRDARGQFVQTLGVALDFAEAGNVSTKKDVFAVYDAAYYFDDRFYAFGLGRLQQDGLVDASTPTGVFRDAFIGVGPGYRVVNTPDMTWRLQAGVGASYLKFGDGRSETEEAGIVSSRFFYKFSDNVFFTNDTDVLKSSTALRVNNDLGVSFKVTDAISTRISYLTDYNDSRPTRTDNKLGLAVVYGF